MSGNFKLVSFISLIFLPELFRMRNDFEENEDLLEFNADTIELNLDEIIVTKANSHEKSLQIS
jgi:hypothetical protein